MQLGPIRPVVSQTISQLALPKLPNERSDLWLTHPSYNGALVYAFESPAHYKPRNYERLEVRRLIQSRRADLLRLLHAPPFDFPLYLWDSMLAMLFSGERSRS